MTEDHEPINPTIHAHLTGLGYVHEHSSGWSWGNHDYYWMEIETDSGVTQTGWSVKVYEDGSMHTGGMPDSHTADLLRFLADVFAQSSAGGETT